MSDTSIYRRKEGGHNSRGKALQLCRRVTAAVALSVMVVYFVMLGTSAAIKLKWITDIQLIPVILTVSGTLILFWAIVTLLFGRVYCSMVCPAGIIQDISARVARRNKRLKISRSYQYHESNNRFRYIWFALITVSAMSGFSMMLAIFDPYSAIGRVMTHLLRPLITVSNGETMIAGSVVGILVAIVTLTALVAIPMKRGRLICNTVCPVGSALSLLSRHSVYGMDINTDLCVNCGLCERVCKSECISSKSHSVDMSRCVVCFDCTAVCESGAITYTRRRHRLSIPMLIKVPGTRAAATCETSRSATTMNEPRVIDRRRFLTSGLILAAAPAVISASRRLDRIKPKELKQSPTDSTRPVTPPGITSGSSFLNKCIGCGACISACQAHVLVPSLGEYGMTYMLHPRKNYDESYCRYNCVRCTEVCPTGALEGLTVEEKHQFRVGIATVDSEACIGCGMCENRCPRGAIKMVLRDNKLTACVEPSECIGCGSCQYICPAQPIKAIKVNGLKL